MSRPSGHSFEQACADLFRKFGFTDVNNIGGPGDCGADITAYNGNVRILAQCKNYKIDHPVGSPDIDRFAGALMTRRSTQNHNPCSDHKRAYFFTTSYFTQPAIDKADLFNSNAKYQGRDYRMELWNASDLNNHFYSYGLPWYIDDKGRLKHR